MNTNYHDTFPSNTIPDSIYSLTMKYGQFKFTHRKNRTIGTVYLLGRQPGCHAIFLHSVIFIFFGFGWATAHQDLSR